MRMIDHQAPPPPPVLFQRLLAAYGPQGWWPVADTPGSPAYHDLPGRRGRPPRLESWQRWEVMAGALLTQNTAWSNAAQALERLRLGGRLELGPLAGSRLSELTPLVRPAGYYNQKARRLRGLARHLRESWRGDPAAFLDRPTASVRGELLGLTGVGPETADSILLYAGNGHHRVCVVDAYARRLLLRLGQGELAKAGYEQVRAYLEDQPWEAVRPATGRIYLYNELHALIVRHGKERCRARFPRCQDCPLREVCQQALDQTGEGPRGQGDVPVRSALTTPSSCDIGAE